MVPGMGKEKAPAWIRYSIYLDKEEAKWVRETRAKYLLKSGGDLSTTSIIRAGIDQLRSLDESRLIKLLDRHRGRRRASS